MMDRRQTIKTIILGTASIPLLRGYKHTQSDYQFFHDGNYVLDPKNITKITYNLPFESQFATTPNRIWLGRNYWANPMEDWRIHDGRLECLSNEVDRNVHILTRSLGTTRGSFDINIRTGLLQQGGQGSTGFRIGVREPSIDDFRSNVFYGEGLNAVLTVDGRLALAGEEKKLNSDTSFDDVQLHLKGEPNIHSYKLTLIAYDLTSEKKIGEITVDDIATDEVIGNIALVNNHINAGSRFWFRDWNISGSKISAFPDRAFGPILWSMYSLNNTGSEDGYVLKISAQMPPIGMEDNDKVALQVRKNDKWKTIGQEPIDPDARNAIFRVTNWNADKLTPYRLIYETHNTEGEVLKDEWEGFIKKDPTKEELSIASLSCQHDSGFPYKPVVDNIAYIDPDVLTFHGDQYYESNGGYGVVRDHDEGGTDKAIINYLRKYYMFGWTFRDEMRSRPTLLMADDHDVFQGNLWGEGGGDPDGTNPSTSGGYTMSPRWINAVHRSQLAHNPDVYDSTPINNNITVWYSAFVYGRTSFAIISERMFKSSPKLVNTGEGRADLVETADFDPNDFNKPGLKLLGDRQINFLKEWVGDWKHAKMKVLLGQSPFANLNTHSGRQGERLFADLDTNGWPQDARDKTLNILRKGFVLHVSGDQHLPSVVQYGIDEPGDANWGYSPPAISVGWPRWWLADEVNFEFTNRPAHNLPNTGEYKDPFGNLVSVHAVGNPTAMEGANRYDRAHVKSSGFGVIRINTSKRTIQMDAYRFLADLENSTADNQFPGWPVFIEQFDNFGKSPTGYLNEVSYSQIEEPVVKVFNEQTEELIYSIRSKQPSFRPFIFEKGSYRVEIGDPEIDDWKVFEKQQVEIN